MLLLPVVVLQQLVVVVLMLGLVLMMELVLVICRASMRKQNDLWASQEAVAVH